MTVSHIFDSLCPPFPEAGSNPWWLDCLVGDSAMAAFHAFEDGLILRNTKVDDHMEATLRSFVSAWSKHFGVPEPRLLLHRALGRVLVGSVDEDGYHAVVGEWPSVDDLHRVNCETPGTVGHAFCGWCRGCERPRFKCGHFNLSAK